MLVLRLRKLIITSVLLGVFAISFSVIIAVASPFEPQNTPPDCQAH